MGFDTDFGISLVFLMIILMFCLMLGVFVFLIVILCIRWNKNNHSPRLTVDATVVSKRIKVSHHDDSYSSTKYYVTFQVASGDRMEFCVRGREQGMLIEGDHGKLFFQGTRYLGFQRM